MNMAMYYWKANNTSEVPVATTVDSLDRQNRKSTRHELILEVLRARPEVRATNIAAEFGVHVETIRRDFQELEAAGKVKRTHGGAVPSAIGFEESLAGRSKLFLEQRMDIASEALKLVNPGEIVMIDVGTTVLHFARRLAGQGQPLTMITNNWKILSAVGTASHVRTWMCPGTYSSKQGGVFGSDTTEYLQRFRADKVILSSGGISELGLFEVDPEFASIKRTMISQARTCVVLVDSSKFGRTAMTRVTGLHGLHHLVTDQPVEGAIKSALAEAGVSVHVSDDRKPS